MIAELIDREFGVILSEVSVGRLLKNDGVEPKFRSRIRAPARPSFRRNRAIHRRARLAFSDYASINARKVGVSDILVGTELGSNASASWS